MKKSVIAIDVDDVLGDENGAVIKFVNDNYGTNLSAEDYYAYEGEYGSFWEGVWNVSDEEARERYLAYKASGAKQNIEPLKGAIQTLSKLKQKYDLVILTARGEDFVDHTHSWLNQHYPKLFKDVHFVPLWGAGDSTKAEVSQGLKVQYLVDDNFDHCSQAAALGVKTLLFGRYGWNKHKNLPKGVVRTIDWQAVEEFFDEQGK